jgi:hypothetical protein
MKTSVPVLNERWRHGSVLATYGKGRHAGALATATWLSARGLLVPPRTRWEVSIALDVIDTKAAAAFADATDTRFHVAITSAEWGFFFCHESQMSWLRVTELPFVHERDDFGLLAHVPPLRALGTLVRALEAKYRVLFHREHASIRTTIAGAEPVIQDWVLTSI